MTAKTLRQVVLALLMVNALWVNAKTIKVSSISKAILSTLVTPDQENDAEEEEILRPYGEGLLIDTVQRKSGKDIVIVDFEKGLYGAYLSASDQCYLLGGVDQKIEDRIQNPASDEDLVKYEVANDYSVTDKSLVPEPLQTKCADKELHWLERVAGAPRRVSRGTDKVEQKFRSLGWSVGVSVGVSVRF